MACALDPDSILPYWCLPSLFPVAHAQWTAAPSTCNGLHRNYILPFCQHLLPLSNGRMKYVGLFSKRPFNAHHPISFHTKAYGPCELYRPVSFTRLSNRHGQPTLLNFRCGFYSNRTNSLAENFQQLRPTVIHTITLDHLIILYFTL